MSNRRPRLIVQTLFQDITDSDIEEATENFDMVDLYDDEDINIDLWRAYTAISIKVVPKKREKVKYERERLIGKD